MFLRCQGNTVSRSHGKIDSRENYGSCERGRDRVEGRLRETETSRAAARETVSDSGDHETERLTQNRFPGGV